MQSITIKQNEAGQRMDKLLHKVLPAASTGFLYKMLRKKNITLNEKKAEGKEILKEGDVIRFYLSDETYKKFAQEASEKKDLSKECIQAFHDIKGIQVLFENEHILAVNKPVGVLTQKAEETDQSLNEWLIGYLLNKKEISEEELKTFHPSVANRLDRNTSGIVLCGKSLPGLQFLSKHIKERTVSKHYRTIVVGRIDKEERIDGYLSKNEATNKVTVVKNLQSISDSKAFSKIHTGYCPIQATNDFTYLDVNLITGKAHQIRAHLASVSHPLIGDVKYGREKINLMFRQKYHLKHQLLHAYSIQFPELEEEAFVELSGKKIIAPLPEQYKRIVSELFGG